MSIKVSPSILAADFGNIERECNLIDKSDADWFHLDVMDGIFVPNISFGMPVVKAIRQMTSKPLDVHLMITEPERYIEKFIDLGSDIISFHIEATNKLEENISLIKSKNIKAGIAINPDTSISELKDIISVILCLIGGYLLTNFYNATVRMGDAFYIDLIAALLLTPYVVWGSYAGALNFSIIQLNKENS